MRIPYGSSVFQLRPHKCIICHLSHAGMFCSDVSSDKIQGFSCFAGNPVYVGVPGQVTGDSEILHESMSVFFFVVYYKAHTIDVK